MQLIKKYLNLLKLKVSAPVLWFQQAEGWEGRAYPEKQVETLPPLPPPMGWVQQDQPELIPSSTTWLNCENTWKWTQLTSTDNCRKTSNSAFSRLLWGFTVQ